MAELEEELDLSEYHFGLQSFAVGLKVMLE